MWKIISGFVIVVCVAIFGWDYAVHTMRSSNTEPVTITIAPGDDFTRVGSILAQHDLVRWRGMFYYYGVRHGLRGQVRSGTYAIAPHSSLGEIVYKITRSSEAMVERARDVKVTFPEGFTSAQMAERLTANGLPGEAFAALVARPTDALRTQFPFLPPNASAEGYLFPDTYLFAVDASADTIITKMLETFAKKAEAPLHDAIVASGVPLHQTMIFASVIEGEVASDHDRRIVAGVFANRLKIGMALQSDATIDFITGQPQVKHTLDDLAIESPYNTYKYPGLPPGPINNPSLSSIRAALDPAQTDYLYFLNNAQTGETVFSVTFDEHVANKGKHGL